MKMTIISDHLTQVPNIANPSIKTSSQVTIAMGKIMCHLGRFTPKLRDIISNRGTIVRRLTTQVQYMFPTHQVCMGAREIQVFKSRQNQTLGIIGIILVDRI
jgi:hypothetical protein